MRHVDAVMTRSKATMMLIALFALVYSGCGGSSTTTDAGDGGYISDSGTTDGGGTNDGGDAGTLDGSLVDLTNSIENCVKALGWQADFTYDSDMIGIPDSSGYSCTDAMTVEWYQETAGADYTHILAWYSIGASTCTTRTPSPQADAAICSFMGTHTWSVIPGVDPATRMILTENVTTVTGDFAGKGMDDKCGPLGIVEGTSTRFVVQLDGPCASGTKAWIWEPAASDTEPFPGNMFTSTSGQAKPYALCNDPGTIGPADHLTGRKICPTTFAVVDVDK